MLADNCFSCLSDKQFFSVSYSSLSSEELNSVAIIAKHMAGNMKSRWTDIFTSDGEKKWRNRELEFNDEDWTKEKVLSYWEESWMLLFDFIQSLDESHFSQVVYIRNMGHTLVEAINRQLAHYSYHVGQIVSISKQIKGDDWVSLSVPRGGSNTYNTEKFSKPKSMKHFTDDL